MKLRKAERDPAEAALPDSLVFSRLARRGLEIQSRYWKGNELALEPEVMRITRVFNHLMVLELRKLALRDRGRRHHNYPRTRRLLRNEALAILAECGVTIAELQELEAHYVATYGPPAS